MIKWLEMRKECLLWIRKQEKNTKINNVIEKIIVLYYWSWFPEQKKGLMNFIKGHVLSDKYKYFS